MPRLLVHLEDRSQGILFDNTPLLSELLREKGFSISTPCGSAGVCSRCGLRVKGSMLPPPRSGFALACKTRLTGDAEVWLDEASRLTNIAMAGTLPLMSLDPLEGDYGLAVDIGTTTIAVLLMDLRTGRQLAAAASGNPQSALSDNVIGRISATLNGQGRQLNKLVREEINRLCGEVCRAADIRPDDIAHTVITGNTAMLYFYRSLNPQALAAAPFQADHLFGEWAEQAVYLPRCIGAFLGADLTMAIVASGMCAQEETALLADIGTNGEIALWHKGQLYCAAAAAGPAFEGGGIKKGLGSVNGAIDTVSVQGQELSYTTIGGMPARGLCGSGLIDAAAAFLELGLMDETGRLKGTQVNLTDDVALYQDDIRKLQLAKGAVAAAIGTLCETAGVSLPGIQRFYLAGGFGTNMNAKSAARIGLIPHRLLDRTVPLGNAALSGAAMLLVDKGKIDESLSLAKIAQKITLSGNALFAELFTERMFFEEY